jgi:hypothetical protein
MNKTLKQQFLENLDVALFPIQRPDFFLNVEEYFDIITKVYLETNREWLLQKQQEKQKTSKYLKEKAKTDLIHRVMYLNSETEVDFITELLGELV